MKSTMVRLIDAVANSNEMNVHPFEYLDDITRIANKYAFKMCRFSGMKSILAVKTIENYLYYSSRLIRSVAEEHVNCRIHGASARHQVRLKPLFQDYFVLITRIASQLMYGRKTRVNTRRSPILVIGYAFEMMKRVNEYITADLAPDYDIAYEQFPDIRLLRRLSTRGVKKKADVILPPISFSDLLAGFAPALHGMISLLDPKRWDKRALWYMAVIPPLAVLMRSLERFADSIAASGCKVYITYEDTNYASFYLHSCLMRKHIFVVGSMHGIGTYGPNFAYDRYCIWGRWKVDEYVERFRLDPSNFVITGNPVLSNGYNGTAMGKQTTGGTAIDSESKNTGRVCLYLQNIYMKNDEPHMKDMMRGIKDACARLRHAVDVWIKPHPGQSEQEVSGFKEYADSIGLNCVFVQGRLASDIFPRTSLTIANYSTVGYESVFSGTPSIFYTDQPDILIPLARYFPDCLVKDYAAYVNTLVELLGNEDTLKRFQEKEYEKIENFISLNTTAQRAKIVEDIREHLRFVR